jgi:hypothetical protein
VFTRTGIDRGNLKRDSDGKCLLLGAERERGEGAGVNKGRSEGEKRRFGEGCKGWLGSILGRRSVQTQGGTVSAVGWVAWRTDRVSRGDAVGHNA